MANCTYCNVLCGSDQDHVVPCAWVGVRSFTFGELVPTCKECNSVLSDVPLHTVEERAAYLHGKYMKRFKKDLIFPEWSKEELSEVSIELQKQIKHRSMFKIKAEIRITNLYNLGKHYLY